MSDQKWESIKVIAEPLRVIFFYECGNAKGASLEEINKSEWDNIALAEGQTLPENREPFFTMEETKAAKRAFADHGIRLA
jgi:hypothetical protein